MIGHYLATPMPPVARCLRAIAACTALGGCGRVGVDLLPDELDDTELGAGAGELDGAVAPSLDASIVEPPNIPDEAGADELLDASVDASPERDDADAGDDAGADTSMACGGARALELCWYLGAPNASCQETCAGRGGYDARMVREVGTRRQGGSAANCRTVLAALGYDGRVTAGYRMDGRGIGCHVWGGAQWWISSAPDFSSRAFSSSVRIACACLE